MKTKQVIAWIARTLGIAFAAFISLFALDVFGVGYGFWESILAFLIHLVPTYLVVIALLVAWRWPRVGALLFIGLGVFYIVMMRRDLEWQIFLLIPGPLFLIGILFGITGFLPGNASDQSSVISGSVD
jgi:hypothetical protein